MFLRNWLAGAYFRSTVHIPTSVEQLNHTSNKFNSSDDFPDCGYRRYKSLSRVTASRAPGRLEIGME